jgi:hypothetical protein
VEAHETQTAEGQELDGSQADGDQPAKKEKGAKEASRGYEAIARQEIRRARRLVTDGQPSAEANFAVQVAGVLAMLDLAAAMRESRNGA